MARTLRPHRAPRHRNRPPLPLCTFRDRRRSLPQALSATCRRRSLDYRERRLAHHAPAYPYPSGYRPRRDRCASSDRCAPNCACCPCPSRGRGRCGGARPALTSTYARHGMGPAHAHDTRAKHPIAAAPQEEHALGPHRILLPCRADAPLGAVRLQVRQAVRVDWRAQSNRRYVPSFSHTLLMFAITTVLPDAVLMPGCLKHR